MEYQGNFVQGSGDITWLELIDKSFSMLHSSSTLPNLKMLYKSETNMFSEGYIWGTGWWIQNSYGFSLGAIPFLNEFWSEILQNSYDAFWTRMGDGVRTGSDSGSVDNPLFALIAPDGSLGDCVLPEGIVYKQGDGDFESYDWCYETTAAGVLLQAEILLFDRRCERLEKYLPLLWRSIDFIEKRRAENGLLLVGTASNLLAPSYAGSYQKETGTIEPAYPAGLAITYAAALRRFIELLKLNGDNQGLAICEERLCKTLAALPLLMTPEGYLAKSLDPDGTLHGVYGAERYGYFEASCNVDAIAHGVVDHAHAEAIYKKIASVHGLRTKGAICANYPHLDDTYMNYRMHSDAPNSLGLKSGDWVDGGCWATVEGRAILAYMRLNQWEDAYKAASWYMSWAQEYRQDAPLSQWGLNENNPWAKENSDYTVCERPVAIMIDNFAPVTCLLRGLFTYEASASGLTITPHLPNTISEYTQKEPIFFGGCRIYITVRNGKMEPAYSIDGKAVFMPINESDLPRYGEMHLLIDCSGRSDYHNSCSKPVIPINHFSPSGIIDGLPDDMINIYNRCCARLKSSSSLLEKQLIQDIILSVEAASIRRKLPFDKSKLRPMTDEKRQGIINAYDQTIKELYAGLSYFQ